jgi:hypothetical protein
MPYRALDAGQIERTIARLARRVERRFPDSGLAGVVRELLAIAERTSDTAAWISRPLFPLRAAIGLFVLLIALGLAASFRSLQVRVDSPTLPELVQGVEAAISDAVYVGLAVFFLVTIETRVKRRRALGAIHELRSIAHVIDMHQLTKDPELVLARGQASGPAAPQSMTLIELSRYLDYCSEALSLAGKVAALYVQRFDDPVALSAVNEIEELTTGLSRKIWQKLTVLYAVPPLEPSSGATPRTPQAAVAPPSARPGSVAPVAAPGPAEAAGEPKAP